MGRRQSSFEALVPASVLLTAAALIAVSASAPVSAQELAPDGEVALRYAGAFVMDDASSDILNSGLETAFRLGLKASDARNLVSAELSLSSGDIGSVNSPWQAFGRFGAGQAVHLDRAWIAVASSPLPELSLVLGQSPVPWGRGEVVWDADLTLPGLWVNLESAERRRLGAWQGGRVNLGAVYLSSGASVLEENTLLFGGELSGRWGFEHSSLEMEVGYFDLVGARRLGRAVARGDVVVGTRPRGFSSNTTDSDLQDPDLELTRRLVVDGFSSDFNILSAGVRCVFTLGEDDPIDLVLDISAAMNLGARGAGADAPFALEVGAQFGVADKAGRGQVRLFGVAIGADAVLDLTNADLYGTNVLGVGVAGALVLFEGVTLSFDTLASAQLDPALRGLGDGRGESLASDSSAIQMRITAGYDF